MDAGTILIVDDEHDILQVIKAYLEKNNYIVHEADSGLKALQLFESLKPDLMVLDLMLPDMSGEEVCRTIRNKSNIPILMLTAKSSEDDMINGLLIGADDYITKPFSPRELLARVISLLRRSQLAITTKEGSALKFGGGRLSINTELHEMILKASSEP